MLAQKKRIIFLLLDSDPALIEFLFDPPASLSLRAPPDIIISDSWELSDERRILLRAALDIWCGRGNVFFWELLNGLNRHHLARVIAAMIKWRDLNLPSTSSMALTGPKA